MAIRHDRVGSPASPASQGLPRAAPRHQVPLGGAQQRDPPSDGDRYPASILRGPRQGARPHSGTNGGSEAGPHQNVPSPVPGASAGPGTPQCSEDTAGGRSSGLSPFSLGFAFAGLEFPLARPRPRPAPGRTGATLAAISMVVHLPRAPGQSRCSAPGTLLTAPGGLPLEP